MARAERLTAKIGSSLMRVHGADHWTYRPCQLARLSDFVLPLK